VPAAPAVKSWFLQRWPNIAAEIFVAIVDSQLVGFAMVEVLPPADPASMLQPRRGATLGLAVDRDHRRQGLGTALLAAAQNWAQARQVGQIFPDFSHQNQAAGRLHEKAGGQVAEIFLVNKLDKSHSARN
jgi:ribosomal protein S18 acetylase RimI-like enzyme